MSDLRTADEAFLSNTVFEILPVIRVDDQVIGDGTPGPITRTMLGAFQTQRRAWIADASNRPLGASPTGASIGADAARCCSDEG